MKPNESGHIRLEGDTIVYTLPEREAWSVPVADIRLIGEFTTNDGPYGDDYFFVFITRGQWFEASFYADGCDALLNELGDRLHHRLHAGLIKSTSLSSQIMWPGHFHGRPLFVLVPDERSSGILGRYRQQVSPQVYMNFADEVRKAIES